MIFTLPISLLPLRSFLLVFLLRHFANLANPRLNPNSNRRGYISDLMLNHDEENEESQASDSIVRRVESGISSSRERRIRIARDEFLNLRGALGIGDERDDVIDMAARFSTMAVEQNFTKGRRSLKVDELTERERELHKRSFTTKPKSDKERVLCMHQDCKPFGYGLCESCYNDGCLSRLPEDLLHDVLVRVAPEKKKKECLTVCRSWRLLLRGRQMTLRILESSESFLSLRARGFESLTSVTIDHRLSIEDETALVTDDDLSGLADEFPELERLELLGCDQVTPAGLVSLVQRCPKLGYLHLQTCPLLDDDAVITVVRSCTALQHLRVAFCEISSAGLEELGRLTSVSSVGCPLSVALASFPVLV